MNGYSSHTLTFWNDEGERVWVKLHFKTDQGIENFTADAATNTAGEDPDYSTQDLFKSIEEGHFPTWTVSHPGDAGGGGRRVQRGIPFDLTKVWPHDDYPLIEVGTMELNRNPETTSPRSSRRPSPANLVPGIGYQPRQDAPEPRALLRRRPPLPHRGRTSTRCPVNQPHGCPFMNTYHRDGSMRVDGNGGNQARLRAELVRRPGRTAGSRAAPAPGLRRRRSLPHPRAD